MEVNDVEYLKAINISRSLREEGTFLEYSRKFKDIYENIDNNRHGFKTLFAYGDESYFVKHEISYRDAREGKYFPPKYRYLYFISAKFLIFRTIISSL